MPEEIELEFEDGSEHLLVTPVDSNLYRLEESSGMGEVVFGDVIEVERHPEGRLQFKRIATPSRLATTTSILPLNVTKTAEFRTFLDRVMSLGGNWELLYGGVLLVHLPQPVPFDVEPEIKAILPKKPA